MHEPSEFETDEGFSLKVPNDIKINVTDPSLFKYDIQAFQLEPLQKVAENSLVKRTINLVTKNVSLVKDVQDKIGNQGTRMVADLSEIAKQKLATGEWKFAMHKNGPAFGVLVDAKTNRAQQIVNLKSEEVQAASNFAELAAIQQQLASIAEQIADLSRVVKRVEQGQYNDRYAGFFSARQQVVEALAMEDDELKKFGIKNATLTANNAIAKLMLTMRTDVAEYLDPNTKTSQAKDLSQKIKVTLAYINATVQLNLMAYTAIGEKSAVLATLSNYRGFINDSLLAKDKYERTVATRMDEFESGDKGQMAMKTNRLATSIQHVLQIDTTQKQVRING